MTGQALHYYEAACAPYDPVSVSWRPVLSKHNVVLAVVGLQRPGLWVPGDQSLLDSLDPAADQPRPPLAPPSLGGLHRPPPSVGEAAPQPHPPRPRGLGLLRSLLRAAF